MTERHVVGLIGAGIGGSLSPALHEREADAQGIRYVYLLLDSDRIGIGSKDLGEVIRDAARLGYAGLNITHPYKQDVVKHLDTVSAIAGSLEAVNTITFGADGIIGHNTDAYGFGEAFTRGLPTVALNHSVVLGAGGAGSAVCTAILKLGGAALTIIDVDPARAGALRDRLVSLFECREISIARPEAVGEALSRADGVVNATPIGFVGHPGTPFDPSLLRPDQWVADVIYRPLETELMSAARARGCQILTGGGMAVFQAAGAFRLFTGREPDAERMLRHFQELITEEDR